MIDERVQVMQDLRHEIIMNDFGLPTGIYRLDLLPFHDWDSAYKNRIARPSNPDPELLAIESGPERAVTEDAIEMVSTRPDEKDEFVESEHLSEPPEDEDDWGEDSDTLGVVDPSLVTQDPGAYIERRDLSVRKSIMPELKGGSGEEGGRKGQGNLTVTDADGKTRVCGFVFQDLHSAFVPLDYKEGFPTFEDGDPFWLQLKFEPPEAYACFAEYLQMSGTEAADSSVQNTNPRVAGATGFRSIAQLAARLYNNHEEILGAQVRMKEWSELYYWDWRAKAYDLFRVARHRNQQVIRAIETEDSHYVLARKLRANITEYMEDEDFMDQMTPKVAIDLLGKVTQLERVSAGLNASSPGRGDDSQTTSLEMTMRRVALAGGSQEEEELDLGGGASLLAALEDPAQLKAIQEVVLKVTRTGDS